MAKRAGQSMNGRDERREDETAVIREDIERTRADMSRTVDALEHRLSPAHLKEQVAELKENVLEQFHDAKEQIKTDLKGDIVEVKDKVVGEIAEAKTAAYDATVGRVSTMVDDARVTVSEAGSSILGTIRANPIPAALVAIGVGWLFVGARARRTHRIAYAQPYAGEELDLYAGYVGDVPDTERDLARSPRRLMERGRRAASRAAHGAVEGVTNVGQRVAGGASTVGHRVADGASTIGHRVAGSVSTVGHKVADGATSFGRAAKEGVSTVGHKLADGATMVAQGASSVAHRASDRAIQVAGSARIAGARAVRGAGRQIVRAEQTVEGAYLDTPLAFGAAALAVGAAVGLALPHTRREDELMGEAKEALLARAQLAAQEAIHRVEERVGEVASVATKAQDTLGKVEASIAPEQPLEKRMEKLEREVKSSVGKQI